MYKLILVDDETDVREGMARTVNWEEHGFTLCGCCSGALEAMEMVKTVLPDVVMTDICMPYMDGLAMIAVLKQLYPAMQFVIVSGHDDFTYAQRAMQYQVTDYLLKPLSAQDVRSALKTMHQRLDEESSRRRDMNAWIAQSHRDLVLLGRMRLMEALLSGSIDMPMQGVVMPFPAHLALVEIGSTVPNLDALHSQFGMHAELHTLAILENLHEWIQEVEGSCLYHKEHFVLHMPCEQEDAVRLIARVLDNLRMYLHLDAKAAVSLPVGAARLLPEMYQRTLLLIENQATFQSGSLYLMDTHSVIEDADSEFLFTLPQTLSTLLRTNDSERIIAFFTQLNRRPVDRYTAPIFLQVIHSIVQSTLLTAAARAGLSASALLDVFHQFNPVHLPEWSVSIATMQAAVLRACTLLADTSSASSREFAQEIASFIAQNYARADLSIADVCARFDISQTQLSLIFKREMGVSFLQYVLDLRINSAQDILLNTDKKIYQIAEDTGFGDPGYFSYCFKQRCGVTPKNFRQTGGFRAH